MRLFQNALLRELTQTSGVTLGALSAIILVTLSIRVLGWSASGDITDSAILPFLGFGYLRFLQVLLTLALYMGVFLTLTRFWQDSEMVIWNSAGLTPWHWVKAILKFAIPVSLLIAFMSLFLLPWAALQKAEYERYLSTQQEVSSLTPGMFTESVRDNRVFFVENMKENLAEAKNVFIQSEENGRLGIVVAQQGKVETRENGDRFLALQNGRRYEGTPGAGDYKIVQFERYSFRLEPGKADELDNSPRSRSSQALLQDPTPRNQAELSMRLSYPISALILAVMAIPLSFYNPRAGRSLSILFAIITYTLYNNIVSISQSWVLQEKLSGMQSLLVVHGFALAILASLFVWRYGLPKKIGTA